MCCFRIVESSSMIRLFEEKIVIGSCGRTPVNIHHPDTKELHGLLFKSVPRNDENDEVHWTNVWQHQIKLG